VKGIPRGLGWRLTISYALVTLVAAGTMSIVTAATLAARGVVSADRAGVQAVLGKDALDAARNLDGGAALDRDAMRFWIAIPVMDDLSRQLHGQALAVAVFDANGRLLVAESCDRRQYSASSSAACLATAQSRFAPLLTDPPGQQAVQSAVQQTLRGASITGTVSGRGFVTTPVPGAAKRPSAAIVALLDGGVPIAARQDSPATFLELWKSSWLPDWFPLILLAIVLGTAIGLVLSRQLVRRLRSMAATVRVWSRGDLTPAADERGADELADLAGDLNQMAEQIRNLLAARREVATLQERHRVQRELHDGVKQELFAASMHLAALRAALPAAADRALDHLGEAQRSGQRAQHELTAIMEQLRPPPLSAGALDDAVVELGSRFEYAVGIPVQRDLPADLHLPDQIEEALFRVVQEALTNVRRHAHASRVTIRLTVEDGTVRLLVTDDGRGLPADVGNTRGLGIRSMRERVEALGGRFEIRGAGQGTRVEVALPTEKPAGEGAAAGV
jgi:NarL family two-component system sensor histidine kinase LiaS